MMALVRMMLALLLMSACGEVFAQRTTRHKLKAASADGEVCEAVCDTIFTAADSTAFAFNGYEKTLRATNESFFVTNRSDSIVDRLSLELTYFDMHGRMLDRRTVEVELELLPGETRKADIRSWDKQKTMYYYRSPLPRSDAQATPYRLKIRLLSATRRR